MSFSRRSLLATFGLALPAVSLIAAEAEAATSAIHKKRKPKHQATHVAHKRKKPAATPAPTQG